MKTTVLTSLYKCEKYLPGYFSWVEKLQDIENIEILLLHNEPSEEELNIVNKYISKYDFLKHIIIPQRETLYATWNRGILLSQGEYIAVWNVDDIRLPDSLYRQQMCLDKNPNAAITYGDCVVMLEYGKLDGDDYVEPEFSSDNMEFYRKHFIGCFPMWRKSVHNEIGYFDEQLRLVADFDFQIRVVRKFDLVKTSGKIGYFLDLVPSKLSSNRFYRKNEITALMMRYGIYDQIDMMYLKSSVKIVDVSNIYYNGVKHSVTELFENYKTFISERTRLKYLAILKQPRFFLAYIKHVVLKINNI